MSIQINLQVINANEVARKLRELGLEADVILEAAVQAGAEILQDRTNADQPGADNQIELERTRPGNVSGKVGPSVEKWFYRFKETGADGHEIAADVASALRFEDGSFRQSASHPGVAADPFLRPAADEEQPEVERAVGNVFANELK